jgi:signal transduction histidine kinase
MHPLYKTPYAADEELGLPVLHHERFLVDDLWNEMCDYVKQELQNSGKPNIDVEFHKHSDNEICLLYDDRQRIRQIFVNLLDNAVLSTKEGHIVFGYRVLNMYTVNMYFNYSGTERNSDKISAARAIVDEIGFGFRPLNEKISDTGAGTTFDFNVESRSQLPYEKN